MTVSTFASHQDVPAVAWRWPNFSPAEIACRGTGRIRIDEGALDKLQALRDALGKPLIIRSAYRSPEHNRAVGGAPASKHMAGTAFDVAMANHDPIAFEAAARAAGFLCRRKIATRLRMIGRHGNNTGPSLVLHLMADAGRSPRQGGWRRMARGRPKIALYSHDTMGLGHFRRNLLLAQAFTAPPLGASVLLLSGMREAGRFGLPEGADLVTLPGWRKDDDGRYAPRDLAGGGEALAALRGAVIGAALDAFRPDLLVVDNAPRGAEGELAPVMTSLRKRGATRCVLGLRDILDEPSVVRRQWWRGRCYEAVGEWFDAIWVYGDPRVCRADAEYGFGPDIAGRVRHLGYLDPRGRLALTEVRPPVQGRYALCAAGGGQDGAALTSAFAAAELPEGLTGMILLGTLAPTETRAQVRTLAAGNPAMSVLDESVEAMALIAGAERVVTMGGYNTTVEALSLRRPTLLVPRVRQRREQAIRAERLAALGLLDVLEPEAATPAAISDWLARPVAPPAGALDFGGLDRAVAEAAALIGAPATPQRRSFVDPELFEPELFDTDVA